MSTVHMLYWIEDGQSQSKMLTDLNELLKESQELRKKEGVRFVCSASENTDQVGKMGVDTVDENYSWYKRRPDPSIPLGRKKKE